MASTVAEERARCALALHWLAGERSAGDAVPATAAAEFAFRASAHPPADAYVVREVFRPAFRNLERSSGGRIAVQEAWSERAHPAKEGFQALADGRTDFAPCYTSWEAQRHPLAQLLALPGLFPSSEVATAVSEELYPQFLQEEFERPGVRMGRLKATGAYHLFCRQPVRSLAGLQGLRVATNAGLDSRVAAAMGATAVPLRSDQLLVAFERGEVDAVSLADGSAEVFGIGTRARCRLAIGQAMMNLEFGLSDAFCRRLPADLLVTLNGWLRAQAQAETQVFYGVGGALARERFARAGCEFVALSAADRHELEGRMHRLVGTVAAELDARSLPASRFIAHARAAAARLASCTADALMARALQDPPWLLPGRRPT